MKGKYAYMAPEQTEGDNIDNRSDIFAIGIVLHEVLTGRRLFKGQNDVQTIERVRRCEVPPPSAQNPAVPPELDRHRAQGAAARSGAALEQRRRHGRRARRHRARGALPADAPAADPLRPVPDRGRRARAAHRQPAIAVARVDGRRVGVTRVRARCRRSRAPSRARTRCRSSPRAPRRPRCKPKSKFPSALVALLVLGAAGFGGWKYLGDATERRDVRVDDGRATRRASSTSS